MPPPEHPTLADVVVLLAAVFDRLRIPYAFGGALATSFSGIPRTTQDADCLVAVPALGYQQLADALAADGFLVDEAHGTRPVTVVEFRRQIADRGFMSLVHGTTTVELFVPLVPLQHAILERAQVFPFADRTIRVTTAEDLILLEMAFHRQKDIMDVKGILHVQRGRLDVGYVRQSAARMLEVSVAAEFEVLLGEYGGDGSAHGNP